MSLLLPDKIASAHFPINLRPRFFIRIKLRQPASKYISSGFINAKNKPSNRLCLKFIM
ncbi:MAG: hypothetical protein IPN25_08065 [Sphingobacteriales bacterium]|nr:hypothetical protein [Sphingobacteriales bacterium]